MTPTAIEARLDRHELNTQKSLDGLWAAVDGLKDRLERLPAWGVALFGLLMFLLGITSTMVGVLARMVTT